MIFIGHSFYPRFALFELLKNPDQHDHTSIVAASGVDRSTLYLRNSADREYKIKRKFDIFDTEKSKIPR